MAIVIEDVELERLALQIAIVEGMPVAEVVRESLLSLAGLRGVDGRRPSLRERFATLGREVNTRAPRVTSDTPSEEDKLDYKEHRAWWLHARHRSLNSSKK